MITVVSITKTFDQLTAHGFRSHRELVRHLQERLDSPTVYTDFVVVISDDEMGTRVLQFTSVQARAYITATGGAL